MPFVAFRRNSEDLLTLEGQGWFRHGYEPEKRAQGREAAIPGPDAVPAVNLQVSQEVPQKGWGEILDGNPGGCLVQPFRGESEQEPEGVPVAGHRVGAGALLLEQPLGEKALQERSEGGGLHGATPLPVPSRRLAAS
jgi:hypothetical protein